MASSVVFSSGNSVLISVGVLVIAYIASLLLVPLVIRAATSRGWLDHPGDRRAHSAPVPRLGGIAVVTGAIVSLLALFATSTAFGFEFLGGANISMLTSVLLGALAVFAIGIADDIIGVSPKTKLVVQTVAAGMAMSGGFLPHSISLSPGGPMLELGSIMGGCIILLWIVGITNAFNLIDGIDGLAGSMALIAMATCFMADLIFNDVLSIILTMALAGSVVAFLRVNWSPARIFLGDSGSMTLGFVLAVRSVMSATDSQGVTYPLVPLVALAYPLLDTFTAMARRWVRGHAFSRADGRHIHHQLRALGISTPRAVQLLVLVFGGVAAMGLAIVFAPTRLTAALALASGVGLFAVLIYGARWLGYHEFLEAGASVASVLRHARLVVNEKVSAGEIASRIREAETIDEVRTLLGRLVEETRVLDVELVTLEESMRRYGPPNQQISPVDALPVRLDYPLTGVAPDGSGDLVLRVWSIRPDRLNHPTAERLASRVGPVLDEWLKARAEESSSSEDPIPVTPMAPTRPVSLG